MLPDQEHAQAQAVSEALENAREHLAGLAGCEPFEIVFTGGGTEANNLAITGLLADQAGGHVLVSALEHPSVTAPLARLSRGGWEIEVIGCDGSGWIDPDQIKDLLRDDTRLVCLQAANPVLGTIQNVRDAADICHNRGVYLHCDATQLFGKMPANVASLRADTVSISGHKFYGPKGSGAIYVRRGLKLTPIAFGEPREMGLRHGPENVPACIGIGAAASLAHRCCVDACDKLAELRDLLVSELTEQIGERIQVSADQVERLPNTLTVEVPGEARELQQCARQLAVSIPQSTSPPDEMTSALQAIGKSQDQISRTIRISMGWTTSSEQVTKAAHLIAEAYD